MSGLRKLRSKFASYVDHRSTHFNLTGCNNYQEREKPAVMPSKSIPTSTISPSDENIPPTLSVIIVGGGLGGLAAAIAIARTNPHHKITVLEQASVLGEVGAGIQVPPNSSKILVDWGLREEMDRNSVYPQKFVLLRYQDGEVLSGYYGLADETGENKMGCEINYGGPYWHIHRADYHRALMEKAIELGVQIKLNSRVASITFEPSSSQPFSATRPTVHLSNNISLTADLVVGADGLKSHCREILLGSPDPPQHTGDLAYRILVRASDMRKYEQERSKRGLGPNDPGSLSALLEQPAIYFWLGPNSHAVCYLLKGGELYNIVLLCPDNLPAEENIAPADLNEMKELFESWDPRLRALLDIACDAQQENGTTVAESVGKAGLTKSHSSQSPTVRVQKWRLQDTRELDTWTHESGTFTLLGDACHATLPYLAQGAAMAIEDAAVLGSLIGKMSDKSQLRDVLGIYEKLRKPRTRKVVVSSAVQRGVFHMEDGIGQMERDRVLREGEERVVGMTKEGRWSEQDGGVFPGFGNAWADKGFRDWLFGYDAVKEVEGAWEMYSREYVGGDELREKFGKRKKRTWWKLWKWLGCFGKRK